MTLPLPPFYVPAHAADAHYSPDQEALAREAHAWRRAHAIPAAAADAFNAHLLLIDVQRDFCFPEGSLYVGGHSGQGALGDNRRIAEFIYRNLARLTHVTATLDTHHAFQIFFASFWVDANGEPLSAHRELTVADLDAGRARPNPAMASWLCNGDYDWLVRQARYYCEELEKAGRYKLYLWPPHCILGSEGNALAGAVHEARMFHSYARSMQSWVEVKGGHPLTENYSVLGAEVRTRFDGAPLVPSDDRLLRTLLSADALIIAGQAASHCVKSTVDDLLAHVGAHEPELARKIYLLTDCMSSVAVPDGQGGFHADFTPETEAALARYAQAGMQLVSSTALTDAWPGQRA